MLEIKTGATRNCEGMTRRDVLKVGTLGLFGLWLAGRIGVAIGGWIGSWLALAVDVAFLALLAALVAREIVGEGLDIAIELARNPGQRRERTVKVIPPELIVRQSTAPPPG